MSRAPVRADGLSGSLRAGLPDLRMVASASLRLHEEVDPERVARLSQRLAAEGVLRNPPVVSALDRDSFVVLDGANRVTALQQARIRDQVVQVVDYDDPAVVLDVWAHLVAEDVPISRDRAPEATAWEAMPADDVRAALDGGRLACGLITPSGAFGLAAGSTLADRVRALAAVVAGYKGRTPIYRVPPDDLPALEREYGRQGALVLFPRFTKQDIRAIAREAVKLPTGISRHVVPLRALRVNVGLDLLRAEEPLAAKQARLEEFIRARLLEHRVRHYPESTVLYDE
ncbi:MAG: hypothetical protein HY355_07210 [Armatimonadetes bacterium]|nr:hypothetical protein [Armatimonadota bacterium]